MTTEHEKMLITKYDLLFESRLTKVETTLTTLITDFKDLKIDMKEIRKEMKIDFLWNLCIFTAGIIGLAGLMAKGFHWL